jgi:hypothetical protein
MAVNTVNLKEKSKQDVTTVTAKMYSFGSDCKRNFKYRSAYTFDNMFLMYVVHWTKRDKHFVYFSKNGKVRLGGMPYTGSDTKKI